jgi:hypothetical protein
VTWELMMHDEDSLKVFQNTGIFHLIRVYAWKGAWPRYVISLTLDRKGDKTVHFQMQVGEGCPNSEISMVPLDLLSSVLETVTAATSLYKRDLSQELFVFEEGSVRELEVHVLRWNPQAGFHDELRQVMEQSAFAVVGRDPDICNLIRDRLEGLRTP